MVISGLTDRTSRQRAGAGAVVVLCRQHFDQIYRAVQQSRTLKAIWLEAYREDYPGDIGACSFVGRSDLELIASRLHANESSMIADLGCGTGGSGRWIARETGARIVGIDWSVVAVDQARRHSETAGLAHRVYLLAGDLHAVPLAAGSVTGAMSVDVWQILRSPHAAIAEVARILAAGARFAFMSWEHGGSPLYLAPLSSAGFEVELYQEPTGWLERQDAVYQGIVALRRELLSELGETVCEQLVAEARSEPQRLRRAGVRRVLVVGRKVGGA